MKLSEHFDRSEFACKCGCGFATVDVELLMLLEAIRKRFNKPVVVTSGCRCKNHNIACGGAYKSKHLEGIACDILVKDTPAEDVYKFVDGHAPDKCGLKLYKDRCHVDVRPDKWRG